MEESLHDPTIQHTAKAVHSLSYAALRPGRTITVGRYANAIEAAMEVNRLEAEGIMCSILNSNVNGLGAPYSGFSSVEVQVHEEDAERAKGVLETNPDELEPADTPDASPAGVDDDRHPLTLVEVGRYESVRSFALPKPCWLRRGSRRFLQRWRRAGPPGWNRQALCVKRGRG